MKNNFEQVILKGNSGCSLNLLKQQSNILCRKISFDVNYNLRLKNQLLKQKYFSSNFFLTPKILNCSYDDKLFYFDMEYINSMTLAQYFEEISTIEINNYIDIFFNNFNQKSSKNNKEVNQIFRNKIKNLEKKFDKKETLKLGIDILKNYDWSGVEPSYCHGDLTLENILITPDKQLYLIDFLDSFYDSWMIDIAKLLQDLELKWSYRYKTLSVNLLLRLQIARDILLNKILELEKGKEKIDIIYHILLLNLFRIYPYSKDDITVKFLENSIMFLTNKLEKEGVYVL